MSATPLTLAKRQQFSMRRWTAVDLYRPAIVLMQSDKKLTVLLAKDTSDGRTGTHFHAVRVIHLPIGWRLDLLELRCRFTQARLADELLFNRAFLLRHEPDFVKVGRQAVPIESAPHMLPLTHNEYVRLTKGSGRYMLSRVLWLFRDHLPASIVRRRSGMDFGLRKIESAIASIATIWSTRRRRA